MTELAINYVVAPTGNFFKSFWATFMYAMELRGMVRAAEELRKMGYIKESNEIMTRARNHERF